MASGQERILRRRIRSVQSTKKITRAMELIAASRIVKAQLRVAAARPYSDQITEVIRNLATAGAGSDHPLLRPREQVANVGIIVLSADRGLAGAYNSSVIRAGERALQVAQREGKGYSLATAGRKAEGYFRYRGYQVDDAFSGFSEKPAYEDARSVASGIMARYEAGDIDQVDLVYTRFLSMGSQRVVTSRLMPLETGTIGSASSAADERRAPPAQGAPATRETSDRPRPPARTIEAARSPQADYEYEPEPGEILERLLPRYVESRVFAALLDAAASEQAARQRAMKSATDNAEELIKSLSIVANKVRQAGITTEIMEIVGGAEAMRQAQSDGPDYLVDTVLSHDVLPDVLDRSGARR